MRHRDYPGAIMRKRREEPTEHVIGELSHTEAFVKKIGELLKQGLTVEDYESTVQSVIGLCKDSYDRNRAGVAAMEVAEQHPHNSETFNLCCRMAGDLYKMKREDGVRRRPY